MQQEAKVGAGPLSLVKTVSLKKVLLLAAKCVVEDSDVRIKLVNSHIKD